MEEDGEEVEEEVLGAAAFVQPTTCAAAQAGTAPSVSGVKRRNNRTFEISSADVDGSSSSSPSSVIRSSQKHRKQMY